VRASALGARAIVASIALASSFLDNMGKVLSS
jgi:hypothetical protein